MIRREDLKVGGKYGYRYDDSIKTVLFITEYLVVYRVTNFGTLSECAIEASLEVSDFIKYHFPVPKAKKTITLNYFMSELDGEVYIYEERNIRNFGASWKLIKSEVVEVEQLSSGDII